MIDVVDKRDERHAFEGEKRNLFGKIEARYG